MLGCACVWVRVHAKLPSNSNIIANSFCSRKCFVTIRVPFFHRFAFSTVWREWVFWPIHIQLFTYLNHLFFPFTSFSSPVPILPISANICLHLHTSSRTSFPLLLVLLLLLLLHITTIIIIFSYFRLTNAGLDSLFYLLVHCNRAHTHCQAFVQCIFNMCMRHSVSKWIFCRCIRKWHAEILSEIDVFFSMCAEHST